MLAIWSAGKAVGVDLSPRPYYVMGPLLFLVMLVPFTVNGIAVREAFFVSFLTALGVAAAPRVRDRLPVLLRDDRARAAGRGHPRLGGAARRQPGGCGPLSDVSVVVVTYNGLPWIEQVSRQRPRQRDGPRRQRLERRYGRVRPRAVSGGRRSSSRRTAGSPPAGTSASSTPPAATSCCSTPTRGSTTARSTRWSRSRTRIRRRPSSVRGCATPTARCSAPCAAFRRCGGSPPSTSSCGSSRRARAR